MSVIKGRCTCVHVLAGRRPLRGGFQPTVSGRRLGREPRETGKETLSAHKGEPGEVSDPHEPSVCSLQEELTHVCLSERANVFKMFVVAV